MAWTVRRDAYGYITAIECDGKTILLLKESRYNQEHAEDVTAMLNLYGKSVKEYIEEINEYNRQKTVSNK